MQLDWQRCGEEQLGSTHDKNNMNEINVVQQAYEKIMTFPQTAAAAKFYISLDFDHSRRMAVGKLY